MQHEPTQLTRRQQQILELLAEGVPFKEIANRLGISFSTVNTHAQKAYERLGVHTAAHAVVAAGLVALPPDAGPIRANLEGDALVISQPWLAAYLEAFNVWMASGRSDARARHAMSVALYGHNLGRR